MQWTKFINLGPTKVIGGAKAAGHGDFAIGALPTGGYAGAPSASTSLMPFSPADFSAAGVVVSGVSSLISVFAKMFKGCGSQCINASKINKTFYAADTNILSLFDAGFISAAQVVQMMRQMLQAAQGDFGSDKHGVAGLQLTVTTLQAVINSKSSDSRGVLKPWPANPHDYYLRGSMYQVRPWTPKTPAQGGQWYSDALDQADQLTDSLIQPLIPQSNVYNPSNSFVQSNPAQNPANPAAVSTGSMKPSTSSGTAGKVLLGGAGALAGIHLLGGL